MDVKQEKGKEQKREFDIVIWGASGFTGRLTAEYIAKEYGADLKWAIAGRDANKLNTISKELIAKNSKRLKLESIPIIIAGSLNLQSLVEMTSRTEVIISTVGPFTKYGSNLVEACIQTKTHYVDITGETWWVRKMIQTHHEEAQKQQVYIVSCCGTDSIPADLSAYFVTSQVKKLYSKSCSQVKGYVNMTGNMSISGGTAASAVQIFDSPEESKGFRRLFFLNSYDQNKSHTFFERDQFAPVYDHNVKSWTKPSLLSACDNRIVRRSHELLSGTSNDYGESFKWNETEIASSFVAAMAVILLLGLFYVLMSIRFTRDLIKRFIMPAPGKGPSEETRARVSLEFKTIATIINPDKNEPKKLTAIFKCGEPGYTETAKMVAESAICILRDRKEFELKGGVLTPASCMGGHLIKRLSAKGFIFMLKENPK